MQILVVDAQGGGIGKQLVSMLKQRVEGAVVTAVGTNSLATSTMLRAGADSAATGENAVIVCARKADVIVGPVGIVIADALMGEVTPAMAVKRVLIPINHCDNLIAGVPDLSVSHLIQSAIDLIRAM